MTYLREESIFGSGFIRTVSFIGQAGMLFTAQNGVNNTYVDVSIEDNDGKSLGLHVNCTSIVARTVACLPRTCYTLLIFLQLCKSIGQWQVYW